MRTNVMVRDFDSGIPLVGDARRLEVVVDGLPLFSGRQLAVDATLVGALHADGSARPLEERTYPELVRSWPARLAVGGLRRPERSKARSCEEIPLVQRRWNKHGDSGGDLCSHVLLRELSPLLFWS